MLSKIQIFNVKERKPKVDVKLRRWKHNRISSGMFDETKEIRFSVSIHTHYTHAETLLLKYMHKHAYKHIGKYTTDVKQQTSERIRQSNEMWKNSNNKSCRHNINTSRAYTYTGIASVISVTQRLWCMRYCVSGAPTHMHTAYDKAFRRF